MSAEKLSLVWPKWRLESLIGEGSFGNVYKAVREEHGITTHAAIKIISIPQSGAELQSVRSEGMDDEAIKTYFRGIVDVFVNEIKMMETLKATPNIVSVEDFQVLEKRGAIGWDIFIRMELLTSFVEYMSNMKNKAFSEAEVIKIGSDILGALEICAQRNIIHRDIKPENIFVSSFGYFKLGDFGIARELEKTSGNMSHKGTYNYIAPEVAKGERYDATVDIYSLGIVLYRLLNNNRLPFLDPNAEVIRYQDRQSAVERRLRGEEIPAPVSASEEMAKAVLKACAYKPADRYRTPAEFKAALETAGEARKALCGKEPQKSAPDVKSAAAQETNFDDFFRTHAEFKAHLEAIKAKAKQAPPELSRTTEEREYSELDGTVAVRSASGETDDSEEFELDRTVAVRSVYGERNKPVHKPAQIVKFGKKESSDGEKGALVLEIRADEFRFFAENGVSEYLELSGEPEVSYKNGVLWFKNRKEHWYAVCFTVTNSDGEYNLADGAYVLEAEFTSHTPNDFTIEYGINPWEVFVQSGVETTAVILSLPFSVKDGEATAYYKYTGGTVSTTHIRLQTAWNDDGFYSDFGIAGIKIYSQR